MQHSHHEESCPLTKWCGISESYFGEKAYVFCKGPTSRKPIHSIKVLDIPWFHAYKKLGATP